MNEGWNKIRIGVVTKANVFSHRNKRLVNDKTGEEKEMNCVNCGGKPYAEDAIGLPYCKNCVADHDSFARRTLVGGRDPQARATVSQYTQGQRVIADDGVGGVGVEKIRELRKKVERAEGKRKKEATLKWHEAHPETVEEEMERYMAERKLNKEAEDDFFN